MKCFRCEDILNFSKPPFGAYCCKNEHVQCAACELICSYCVKCGENTKYKSPHFIDEKTTDPKELDSVKLQVPAIRDIKPTAEEEAQFQKLRCDYTMGKDGLLLGLKNNSDLSTARTLSAIVTKNLYTTTDDNNQADIADESHDLRLQRIIRNLRETRFSLNDNEIDMKKDQKHQKHKPEEADKTKSKNLLTPTHSKLEMPKTGKNNISKINLSVKTDAVADKKTQKTEADNIVGNLLNASNFKSLSCSNILQQKLEGFPISIEGIGLDRRPFGCPLGNCVSRIFISDLNQHIIHDHPALALSPIKVGQFKDFFIDVGLCQNSFTTQSVACFLLRKIVMNFGVPPLKDVLPLTLMIGRYNLARTKIYEPNMDCNRPWSTKDFFLIWLAGVTPDQCDITASISVFSKHNAALSRWYVDRVNSIQNIKDVESTFNSAGRLVLSYPELKLLTNDFKEMLQCQVGVLSCELKSIE